jgi:hypothetical protein
MAFNLGFRKRAERNDDNPIPPSVLYPLAHKSFADLSATQSGRHISMVDDNAVLAGSTVGHLRFDAIDN